MADGKADIGKTGWRSRALIFLGSSFGLGYAPIAPGTAGALPGVGIFVLISLTTPSTSHTWLLALALSAVCAATLVLSPWAERHWGRKDPGVFTLDEIAGFLLTVLLFRTSHMWLTAVWAFMVTRICDILKPFPARRLERLPSGWGILADDLCTSIYAAGILRLVSVIAPGLVGSA
jgi:phosphatidylglycerophosphatase A